MFVCVCTLTPLVRQDGGAIGFMEQLAPRLVIYMCNNLATVFRSRPPLLIQRPEKTSYPGNGVVVYDVPC